MKSPSAQQRNAEVAHALGALDLLRRDHIAATRVSELHRAAANAMVALKLWDHVLPKERIDGRLFAVSTLGAAGALEAARAYKVRLGPRHLVLVAIAARLERGIPEGDEEALARRRDNWKKRQHAAERLRERLRNLVL